MERALIAKSIFVLRYHRQRLSDMLLKDWQGVHYLKKQSPQCLRFSHIPVRLHSFDPGGCQS